MCSMDCFNCTKPDCDYGEVTEEERKAQDEIDRKIRGEMKYGRNKAVWDYQHSEKGKAAQKRYNASEKGKARKKRYMKTEKGKEMQRERSRKRVANGKNAEYCRAYYQRQKLKKMEVLENEEKLYCQT